MPVMNGLEATLQIKRHHKAVKVIVLTMHGEPALIKRMMEIGADGFLLKNSDRTEFVDALARVSAGKTYFSSDAAQAVISGKSTTINTYQVGEESLLLSTLSERELEILKEVASGFTNKEIAEKLFISHRTVDAHRTNVMKKLEIHNAAGLVKFALQNGLIQG
jgi:two-component system response regulator NreC